MSPICVFTAGGVWPSVRTGVWNLSMPLIRCMKPPGEGGSAGVSTGVSTDASTNVSTDVPTDGQAAKGVSDAY